MAAIKWKVKNGAERVYAYGYDQASRLQQAHYAERGATGDWDQGVGGHQVQNIGYDLNGNYQQLTRFSGGEVLDDLNYSSYDGNQLKAVDDTGTPEGFADGNTGGNDYAYDANGNMTQDLNKGISAIDYNLLNLPAAINFADGRQIIYVYDAAGNKLDQQVTENGVTTTTHYTGSIQYSSDDAGLSTTNFLSTSEGRAVPDLAAGGWDYEYFLKDHLGNTRVSVGTKTETLTFTATMEAADATEEETYFKNLPETRHQDALYNHTSGGSYTAWLNGAQGRITGTRPLL